MKRKFMEKTILSRKVNPTLIEPMDLLLLCILVYYLAVVFKKNYPDRLYNAAELGSS